MRTRFLRGAAVLALALAPAGTPATAQEGATFTPLVRLWQPTAALVLDGHVFCGTNDGGVVAWPEQDPQRTTRWLAGSELSSAAVRDLAWTGRHLWVASADAGMTRVADPAGAPAFRLFSTNLRSFDVSAVAGLVSDGSERVWYGAVGEGLGEIIDDQPGALYTTTDGLPSLAIQDLALLGEELFVATDRGVVRFVDGVFEPADDGLADPDVRVLAADGAGSLVAGGAGGVHRWDPDAQAWTLLGGILRPVEGLAAHAGDLYALGELVNGTTNLSRWDEAGGAFAPVGQPSVRTEVVAAGASLWIAGRYPVEGMVNATTFPFFRGRLAAGDAWDTWISDGPTVPQPFGVAFGADGRVWAADFLADALAVRREDGTWSGVYQRAAAAPDSSGLINFGGNMLFMATDTDGAVWTGQLGAGILRTDPATLRTDNVRTTNSGLASTRLINGVAHPAGPVVFMFDGKDEDGHLAQVLLDPAHWRNPENWLLVPDAELGGTSVADVLVERADVLWFAARETGGGVVRWDVNGPDAGPDDPLTWTDPTDDDWSVRVEDFVGSIYDPREAIALARDGGGRIWVGGNGLVAFRYDEEFDQIVLVTDFGARGSDRDGLIASQVTDVAVDRNDHVWVVTAGGLNRVRRDGDGWAVDAWFDAVTYSITTDYGILYSPTRVSALTGVNHLASRLVAEPGGERLLLSCSRGVTLVEVEQAAGGSRDDGAGAFLYPNPWDPGEGARLALGGLDVAADQPLDVGIYNLEGQLVYRDAAVLAGQGFWAGDNRTGSPVQSGMYVVRVRWQGKTIVRTLAVVR